MIHPRLFGQKVGGAFSLVDIVFAAVALAATGLIQCVIRARRKFHLLNLGFTINRDKLFFLAKRRNGHRLEMIHVLCAIRISARF